jgi:TolC family type I secretion outer membrane protein
VPASTAKGKTVHRGIWAKEMNMLKRQSLTRPAPRATALAAAGALLFLSACAHNPPKVYGAPGTAPAANVPWIPPPQAVASPSVLSAAPAGLPAEIAARASSLTLADIVDVALRQSPLTAQAWAQARSAAAAYGSEKSQYYPELDASASFGKAQGSIANGNIAYFQQSYGYGADLTWLLFDFGGRKAAVEEKRQALLAADWSHNSAIQSVILGVEQAYYDYVNAKALLDAAQASFKDASSNLEAAEARHSVGVATIADVLQARTAKSQAQLMMDAYTGQIATTRGALATAMGLPANTPYDVALPQGEPPSTAVSEAVERYLDEAQRRRPDLAAARSRAMQAQARVRSIRSHAYPSLSATGTAGRTYYDNRDIYGNTYNIGVQVRVPLFTGFKNRYDLLQAKADMDAANASLKSQEQMVALQVWSSYYNLKTASQRLDTSKDLMESATKSYEVALARYKEGVGTILDLLQAQSALENARAQSVEARSDWFTSAAQLAYDTGSLSLDDPNLKNAVPTVVPKETTP